MISIAPTLALPRFAGEGTGYHELVGFDLPRYFLDPKSGIEREKGLSREADETLQHERRLFCARCRHAITHQEERISVSGGHEHHVTNPHGFNFHIGCFREASGCTALGTFASEHSWFPGYGWQIACCRNCETHLGWWFTGAMDGFYGLILDRLSSVGSSSGTR